MDQLRKEHLAEARARMKFYADQHRIERELQMGDSVHLKLQPYKQQSIATRINPKLSAKYYGPYRIIRKTWQVAYELELPNGSKIHPIFHVSLLKKKIGDGKVPILLIPDINESEPQHGIPQAVLQTRIVKQNNQAITQWLVQWVNASTKDAMWEDAATIQTQFPDFQP